MAKHKGDMLEALRETMRREHARSAEEAAGTERIPLPNQAAGDAAEEPVEGPPPAEERPVAPVGEKRESVRPKPGFSARQELDEIDRRIAEARAQGTGAVVHVLEGAALLAAFLLGRFTAPSAPAVHAVGGSGEEAIREAAGREGPREGPGNGEDVSSALQPPPRASRQELLEALPSTALLSPSSDPTKDFQAFNDPLNTHTVQAITYDHSEENVAKAFAVFDDLRLQGLPAVTPMRVKEKLMVFVGAAAGSDLLQDLRNRVRQATGPDGRGTPYQTALIVPTEPYRSR